jgi:ribonuclease P protein component
VPARPTPSSDPDRPEHLPPRERRLRTPQMYKQVFETGRALRSAPLTVRYARLAPERTRVGFIIRKRSGNAPLRNAIRRMLRQCFFEALPSISEGTWVVFDVPERASRFSRAEMRAQAKGLLAAIAEER